MENYSNDEDFFFYFINVLEFLIISSVIGEIIENVMKFYIIFNLVRMDL